MTLQERLKLEHILSLFDGKRQFGEILSLSSWIGVVSLVIAMPSIFFFGYVSGARVPTVLTNLDFFARLTFREFGPLIIAWVISKFLVEMLLEAYFLFSIEYRTWRVRRRFNRKDLRGALTRNYALGRLLAAHNKNYLAGTERSTGLALVWCLFLFFIWSFMLAYSTSFIAAMSCLLLMYCGLSAYLANIEMVESTAKDNGLLRELIHARRSNERLASELEEAQKSEGFSIDASMVARISRLEEGIGKTRKRIAQMETIISEPTAARRKMDLRNIARSVSRDFFGAVKRSHLKKTSIVAILSFSCLLFGIERGLLRGDSRLVLVQTSNGEFCAGVVAWSSDGMAFSTDNDQVVFIPVGKIDSISGVAEKCLVAHRQ